MELSVCRFASSWIFLLSLWAVSLLLLSVCWQWLSMKYWRWGWQWKNAAALMKLTNEKGSRRQRCDVNISDVCRHERRSRLWWRDLDKLSIIWGKLFIFAGCETVVAKTRQNRSCACLSSFRSEFYAQLYWEMVGKSMCMSAPGCGGEKCLDYSRG